MTQPPLEFFSSDKNISSFLFKLKNLEYNLRNPDEFLNKKCSQLKHLTEKNLLEKNEDMHRSKEEIIKKIEDYESDCKQAIELRISKKEELFDKIKSLYDFASKWMNYKFQTSNNDILYYQFEENNAKLILLENEIKLFMCNYTLMEFNEKFGCLIQMNAIDSEVLNRIDLNKLNNYCYCD